MAKNSARGIANHTPFAPKIGGSISSISIIKANNKGKGAQKGDKC